MSSIKIFNYLKEIWYSTSIKQKLLFTFLWLLIYRFLVVIPVPFVDIQALRNAVNMDMWWLEYFAMLLWWTLEQFSIIAVGLIPFINASIIMQLLTAVVPKLEELQEEGEVGYMQIQKYTRWLTLPLAFMQSIWMVYFINAMLWGQVIDTSNITIVLLSAFVMTVWTILLMWIWELITEKGISNGISLIIFSSIVAWMTSKIYTYISSAWADILWVLIFMLSIVLVLIILSILLIRTRKEIPVVYARQWKVEETAVLPIPLNPVWMIPIIFAIAFVSFPYLLSQIFKHSTFWTNPMIQGFINFVEQNLNIYTTTPPILAIVIYFVLIVLFTYFYTFIVFNPDKIADNIQKRGGFIPGIRPWEETATYLNSILMKLCFLWWIWLAIIGVYTYVIAYIPLISNYISQIGSIPVVVSGAGIIIIVWVVQEIINKLNAELAMERYDRI